MADLAEFIRLAHPKKVFGQAAEDACICVSGVVEKLVFLNWEKFYFKEVYKLLLR